MRALSDVMGIGVDRLSAQELLKEIEGFISERRPHQITYVNAHCINYAAGDKDYLDAVRNSEIVYADGMAVVWASHLGGHPLPERVNLGDFLFDLCRMCVDKGYRIFLLGGDGVAEKTADNLKKAFPSLKITGTHDGFFSEECDGAVIERINNSAAEIVLVGMGMPRQEKWIARNKDRINAPVIWGVGGLFDYYSGRIKRAPAWMRRSGMEWLFRLLMEPARLWKRYIVGNFLFLLRLIAREKYS